VLRGRLDNISKIGFRPSPRRSAGGQLAGHDRSSAEPRTAFGEITEQHCATGHAYQRPDERNDRQAGQEASMTAVGWTR